VDEEARRKPSTLVTALVSATMNRAIGTIRVVSHLKIHFIITTECGSIAYRNLPLTSSHVLPTFRVMFNLTIPTWPKLIGRSHPTRV